MKIVRITGDQGKILEPAWLERAERVHRQLRPQIPADYAEKMQRVFAGGGEMCVCVEQDRVLGVAVYRDFENTFDSHRFYIDDLVTDETQRSRGVGHALVDYLRVEAVRRGCTGFTLESGVQRGEAHKFYFREGFTVTSFSFKQKL